MDELHLLLMTLPAHQPAHIGINAESTCYHGPKTVQSGEFACDKRVRAGLSQTLGMVYSLPAWVVTVKEVLARRMTMMRGGCMRRPSEMQRCRHSISFCGAHVRGGTQPGRHSAYVGVCGCAQLNSESVNLPERHPANCQTMDAQSNEPHAWLQTWIIPSQGGPPSPDRPPTNSHLQDVKVQALAVCLQQLALLLLGLLVRLQAVWWWRAQRETRCKQSYCAPSTQPVPMLRSNHSWTGTSNTGWVDQGMQLRQSGAGSGSAPQL